MIQIDLISETMKRANFQVPVKREHDRQVPPKLARPSENTVHKAPPNNPSHKTKQKLKPCVLTTVQVSSTKQVLPTIHVAPPKQVAHPKQVAPAEQVAPPEEVAAPQQVAPTVQMATPVQVAPTAQLLPADQVPPTTAQMSTTEQVSPSVQVSPLDTLTAKVSGKGKLKRPQKPVSSFAMFIKQHCDTLSKKGLTNDEATTKAVNMWRSTSPAVKNKYQSKYLRLKAKYEVDMNKYNEKIKKKKEQDERKEGVSQLFLLLLIFSFRS